MFISQSYLAMWPYIGFESSKHSSRKVARGSRACWNDKSLSSISPCTGLFSHLFLTSQTLCTFYLPIRFFVASLTGSFRSTSLPGPRMPLSSMVSRMCLTRLVLSDSQCLFLSVEASSSLLLLLLLLLHPL